MLLKQMINVFFFDYSDPQPPNGDLRTKLKNSFKGKINFKYSVLIFPPVGFWTHI